MAHCNDQLIDQLLTQAEQEGRCLIPPSTAIRKALLRRTGGTVVSPMPGLFARKTRWDELNRAQRHCEILRALAIIHPDWTFCSFSAACLLELEVSWRHLNVVHVCSATKPSARPGAHIQRHQIEPAGAILLSGISVTPPIQTATDCLLQTGFANGMPIVFRTAVKPTPSIYKEQDTVDYIAKADAKLQIKGRHDPCIVPRAAVVQNTLAAFAVLDLLTVRYGTLGQK